MTVVGGCRGVTSAGIDQKAVGGCDACVDHGRVSRMWRLLRPEYEDTTHHVYCPMASDGTQRGGRNKRQHGHRRIPVDNEKHVARDGAGVTDARIVTGNVI